MYYDGKLESLKDIFGTDDIVLKADSLAVGGAVYPVIDDVILLSRLPAGETPKDAASGTTSRNFSSDWAYYTISPLRACGRRAASEDTPRSCSSTSIIRSTTGPPISGRRWGL